MLIDQSTDLSIVLTLVAISGGKAYIKAEMFIGSEKKRDAGGFYVVAPGDTVRASLPFRLSMSLAPC